MLLCRNNDTLYMHNCTETVNKNIHTSLDTMRSAQKSQSCHQHFSRNITTLMMNGKIRGINIRTHTHKYIISTKCAYSRPQILLILSRIETASKERVRSYKVIFKLWDVWILGKNQITYTCLDANK